MRAARGRTWLLVALLLAATLAIRLGYVAATPHYELLHDALDYDSHAVSIAATGAFTTSLGRETAFRPPGYPYLLAGVYRLAGVHEADVAARVRAARIAQAAIGTLIVALIGLLCAWLWGRRVALVALALAAIYLPLVLVGGAVMSEPLFVLLMLAAMAAALAHRRSRHRLRFAVLAGVLAGLATLTRANGGVLLVALAFAVWDARPRLAWRALAAPALLVAAAILTVAPWTVRNAIELDRLVPVSTQLGSALAGTYNDEARLDRENPASWRHLRRVPDYAHLYGRVRETNEAVLEGELRAAALRYAADHPGYVAQVAWWTSRRLVELGGRDWWRHTAATISIPPRWADAGVVCFWLFAFAALIGCLLPAARRAPAWFWAVPVLMYLSVVFLVVETPRYRSAIDPFVVILAALAVSAAIARRRGARP